jgi:hypothetical protein
LDGWDSFFGVLKTVGGGLEVVAGVGLVAAGVATGWTGVGIGLAVAGAAVVAHGADTTQAGLRQTVTARQTDTLTSTGLQAAGMSPRAANLTDAGIGIVFTLGAGALAKAPATVAVAAGEGASVSVSHAAGAPSALGVTNPLGYAVGHTRVGVDLGEGAGTVWSHLTVPATGELGPRVMMSSGGLVESGTAVVTSGAEVAPRFASIATIPVTAAEARAAQGVVDAAASAGNVGNYAFLANDCTTYGVSVLRAANVTASGSTPATLFMSAALRSEAPVTTLLTSAAVMQPVTTAGAVLHATVGVETAVRSPDASGSGPTAALYTPASGPDASASSAGLPNPADFTNFSDFAAATGAPYSNDFIMERWASVHGWVSGN